MNIYTKKLELGEYRNIFELATQFTGNLSNKLAALKISEKISKESTAGTIEVEGIKTLPSSIVVTFTKIELEGYWQGILGYISAETTKLGNILIAKDVCRVLGMSTRFSSIEDSINVTEDTIQFD